MKKLLLLAIIVLSACNKNANNPVTPSNPSNNTKCAHFIPNWWDNDTLLGYMPDVNGNWNGKYDTIYTSTVNDTSFIIHKGTRYYIWTVALSTNDTFVNNQQQYLNICVNTTTDTIGMPIVRYANNIAQPYRYKDAAGGWSYNKQYISLNTDPKLSVFNAISGQYYGINEHK